MEIVAADEGLDLVCLLLFGQPELLDEISSQGLHCTSSQVLCAPPLNHGPSHP